MDLKIDTDAVLELAAQKVADEVIGSDHYINETARKLVEAKVNAIFAESAQAQIEAAISGAVKDALNKSYTPVTAYGMPKGQPTTILTELEKVANTYWSAKVDKYGKPTDSSYDTMTRAQFVMAQVCAADFTDQMKQVAISMTGALKDGLRTQLAGKVDGLLNELFRVKSLADQGKAEKPW